MTRRKFVTGMAAALAWALPASVAPAQDVEPDAVTFVRGLYQSEISRDARGETMSNAELQALFTRDVRRLLQSPIRPQPNAMMIGRGVHAFYGPGMLPGREVRLRNVALVRGTSVAVDLTVHGVARHIVVRAVREDGAWRIADIGYGQGESYVAFQRGIRGQ
jgi:hypothetical protein